MASTPPTPRSPPSPLYVANSPSTPIPPSITSNSEVSSPHARLLSVAAGEASNSLPHSQPSVFGERKSLHLQTDSGPILTVNRLLADYSLIEKQLTALKEQILEQESSHEDQLSRMEIKYWNMSVQTSRKAPVVRFEGQNDDRRQFEERLEGLQCKLAQAEYEIQQLSKENQQLNKVNQQLSKENQQLSALNRELQCEAEFLEDDDEYIEEDEESEADQRHGRCSLPPNGRARATFARRTG
jgi:DNA repair exonuclease SbcCD ATPase subunit